MCFSQTLMSKILINKGPDVNFLLDLSKTMLVLLESNKKCGLSHFFFEISFAKVAILLRNNTFFVDKMRFPSILRSKILKSKGPDVNFLFDLSRIMLVLLESIKKFALACLFMEISVAKVTILSQNHTIFGDKMCFSQTLR